ncbi:MAG: hypothetical protein ACYCQL_13220, partial [Acidithiobacillus sp.]
HFTVKGNQPTLEHDIAVQLEHCGTPDFVEVSHQTFRIERECLHKKSGKRSLEVALGITSRPPQEASPQRLLE